MGKGLKGTMVQVRTAAETFTSSEYQEDNWSIPGTSGSRTISLLVPENLSQIGLEMEKLLTLRRGWNSYDASPIMPSAVNSALGLLIRVGWKGPLPSVSPTPFGGVQLEWGTDDQAVELEFLPSGAVSILLDIDGQVHEYSEVSESGLEVEEALRWAHKLA